MSLQKIKLIFMTFSYLQLQNGVFVLLQSNQKLQET